MPNSTIKSIKAREILDSRGNPAIEVDLETDSGVFQASGPSGVSKGKFEALELRDKKNKGVSQAIKNVNEVISPQLIGKDCARQKETDGLLVELDGTKNKSKLGANAILPVSMAVCRAGAKAQNLSLWQWLSKIAKTKPILPVPSILLIEGGLHGKGDLALQEFMIAPESSSFKKRFEIGNKIYQTLGQLLEKKYGKFAVNLGIEGGFIPPLKTTKEALDLIIEAIKESGFENETEIILDAAASSFHKKGKYCFEKKILNEKKLLTFYLELLKKYPIIAIEDPFSEEDWEGWQALSLKSNIKNQKSKILIIGDDLLATNPERIKEAQKKSACNAAIIKINQIGTITEAIEAVKLAKSFGWKIVVSHRAGETRDDFIADLATGIGADFIKAGSPSQKERMAKYKRLLKIEEELKKT